MDSIKRKDNKKMLAKMLAKREAKMLAKRRQAFSDGKLRMGTMVAFRDEFWRKLKGNADEGLVSPSPAEDEAIRPLPLNRFDGKVKSIKHHVGVGKLPKFCPEKRFLEPKFAVARVLYPNINVMFFLEVIGVKENPDGPMNIPQGVMTKGITIEVDVSVLNRLMTPTEVVQAKSARVTNNPEIDGFIEAVFLD